MRPDPGDQPPVPPSDEVRAGEYVLGVLDAQERRRVQARMVAEPGFARLVEAWEARFADWTARAEPLAPGDHVWPRIRTRLGWSPVARDRTGLWNSVGLWRTATALAAAAALAAVLIGRRPAPLPTPAPAPVVQAPATEEQAARPVTVLRRDDGQAGWIARVEPGREKVLMVPVPAPVGAAGRADELWIIPAGGAPISLGFVSNEKAHTIAIPEQARQAVASGAVFAVTLEPEAGMPHAAPSGPVVAQGTIQQI